VLPKLVWTARGFTDLALVPSRVYVAGADEEKDSQGNRMKIEVLDEAGQDIIDGTPLTKH
jgi:hypothetical protein